MKTARTFATNFVLDVLETKMDWEIDVEQKTLLFDELEALAADVQRDAVEGYDESHEGCVPEEEVVVRRKKV